MADINYLQRNYIKTLVRRANRRIERAYEQKDFGMARALEYYVQKAIGQKKWSAKTKGMSYEAAVSRIKQLETFLEGKSTTRKGWAEIKEANLRKALEKLKTIKGEDGEYLYANLTYEQLSEALRLDDEKYADRVIKTKQQSVQEFYRVVNTVAAAIEEAEDPLDVDISAEIAAGYTSQQALDRLIQVRDAKRKI